MSNDNSQQGPPNPLTGSASTRQEERQSLFITPPEVSLPQGGGAVQAIGQAFQVNAATATASMSVPLAAPPGRNGMGPNLSLTYNSGSGNGPFGLGWSLDAPMIQRRTDKRLPTYTSNDTFMMGGSELVPKLVPDNGSQTRKVVQTWQAAFRGEAYDVTRYLRREEGAFDRIDHYQSVDRKTSFWRVHSRDNGVRLYGMDNTARIVDPADTTREFAWYLQEIRDDRGQVVWLEYKPEDRDNVDLRQPSEAHRHRQGGVAWTYLKRVRYGNRTPDLVDPGAAADSEWCFDLVFDYGEHDETGSEVRTWPVRLDTYSDFRGGFDRRCYRLCRQVLAYHRFASLGSAEDAVLVGSTKLHYQQDRRVTLLTSVTHEGHRDGETLSQPPATFEYAEPRLNPQAIPVSVPSGFDPSRWQWVDLNGEGLPGLLSEQAGSWWYARNEGGGVMAPAVRLGARPNLDLGARGARLVDLDGNGQIELAQMTGPVKGTTERKADTLSWDRFRFFKHCPNIDPNDPNVRMLDLDGDGRAELVVTEESVIRYWKSEGRDGYSGPHQATRASDERDGPTLVFQSESEALFLADMTGDGLTDLVRIRNGNCCYWPNKGHGFFGAQVPMAGIGGVFTSPDLFDPARIRLADIDGTGTTDLLYLAGKGVLYWPNQSGNAYGPRSILAGIPTHSAVTISVSDVLGEGVPALTWSSTLPNAFPKMQAMRLMADGKPWLMRAHENGLGQRTEVTYTPSTEFYLADRCAGTPWATNLPFPVHCVSQTETYDALTGHRFRTRRRFRHGFYDGIEREFRGFARVDAWDTETVPLTNGTNQNVEHHQPPVHAITWNHTGAYEKDAALLATLQSEWWSEGVLPDIEPANLPHLDGLSEAEVRDVYRALRGQTLRSEVYAEDGVPESVHPYSVSASAPVVRIVQPGTDTQPPVVQVVAGRSMTAQVERDPSDPRIAWSVPLFIDGYGTVLRSAAIGEPRQSGSDVLPEQQFRTVVITEQNVLHVDSEDDRYFLAVPLESATWHLTGFESDPEPTVLDAALRTATEIGFHATPTAGWEKRLLTRQCMTYTSDDLASALPFGSVGQRVVVYETRALAFDDAMLADLLDGASLSPASHGYVAEDGHWWVQSGHVTVYGPFVTPLAVEDTFGNTTTLTMDADTLLPETVTDAIGNTVTAANDYIHLSPWRMTDPNGHVQEVQLDALGRPIATAVRSADGVEGDTLADPTSRMTYDTLRWVTDHQPANAFTETREVHGDSGTRWQKQWVYTDGGGNPLVTKVLVEPDANGNPQYIGNGRTVLDNKGNPIKQYEPYFTDSPDYDAESGFDGVSAVLSYDAVGRLFRTDMPDGTFARVSFTPWEQTSEDAGDTVLESRWYAERQALAVSDPGYIASVQSSAYANTPTVMQLDALGRPIRIIAHNGFDAANNDAPIVYTTEVALDIQGNAQSVTDPRGIVVQTARYDRMGRALEVVSPDDGTQRSFIGADDQPVIGWRDDDIQMESTYDELRRPMTQSVTEGPVGAQTTRVVQVTDYGNHANAPMTGNFAGQVWRTWDTAGRMQVESYTFKGQPEAVSRRFLDDTSVAVDWTSPSEAVLQTTDYTSSTLYDALGRPTETRSPGAGGEAVQTFTYTQRGTLQSVSAASQDGQTPAAVINDITYDAKGQRQTLVRQNGVTTSYSYDQLTYRLARLTSVKVSNGDTLQDLTYTYDAAGNIVRKQDDAQQAVFFANNIVDSTEVYTYDPVGRLIQGTGRERIANDPMGPSDPVAFTPVPASNDPQAVRRYEQKFSYDPCGNLTKQNHFASSANSWVRNLTYAVDSNTLASTEQGGTTETYDYNARSGMTRLPHLHSGSVPGTINVFRDFRNQMVGAQVTASATATYVRDGSGQRVQKRVVDTTGAGQTEERLYLGDAEVYRKWIGTTLDIERWTLHVSDGSGRVDIIDTQTASNSGPIASPTSEHRIQLMDHLGNSSTEVDHNAAVISAEAYYPYGSCAWWAGSSSIEVKRRRYRYTGKERDEETGLQDHGARMYAPWLCRWLSADPAWFVDGPNRWAYVSGRPIGASDPTGLGAEAPREPETVRPSRDAVHDGPSDSLYCYPSAPAEEPRERALDDGATIGVTDSDLTLRPKVGFVQGNTDIFLGRLTDAEYADTYQNSTFLDRGLYHTWKLGTTVVSGSYGNLTGEYHSDVSGEAAELVGTSLSGYGLARAFGPRVAGSLASQTGGASAPSSVASGSGWRQLFGSGRGRMFGSRSGAVRIPWSQRLRPSHPSRIAPDSSISSQMRALSGQSKRAQWVGARQDTPGLGLRGHFAKHGDEVGSASVRGYELSSRLTMKHGRSFTYRDRASGASRVGYHDSQTGLFTATSQTRSETAILSHFPETWEALRRLPGFSLGGG